MAYLCCTDMHVEKHTWRGLHCGMPSQCKAFTPSLPRPASVLGPSSTRTSALFGLLLCVLPAYITKEAHACPPQIFVYLSWE